MSRLVWLFLVVTLAGSVAPAQNWQSINLPTNVIDWGNFYLDTTSNSLYASGINQVLPGQAGLFRSVGAGWDTIGYFSQSVRQTLLYHDSLLAGGVFHTVNGESMRACAIYDGDNWYPFGTFDGSVLKLRILDDTLYAVGTFSQVDGQACDGIVKRVGGHWEPVGDFGEVPDPNLFDVIKYHGDLICCGNMEILGEDYIDIFIYQNGEWGPLGGGLLGGMSGGWEMTIYHDELILAGGFYLSAGNAGQCIMRWNGNIWQPLGVGTTDNTDSYSSAPNIHALCVHNDLLFVGGGFSFAGHVPAKGIATWDGSQWCGLGSDLGLVHDIVFFHDTLYAMCSNNWIDGEYNTGGVRYLHTTYGDTCSLPTAIVATPDGPQVPSVVFTDGSWRVLGLPDGSTDYTLLDATGRLLSSGTMRSTGAPSQEIPLYDPSPGILFLRLHDGPVVRFVVN